jgi:uncharacterized protein involved in exopolysaccharide biosynthesis
MVPGTHLGHAGGAPAAAQAGMSAGDVWRVLRANGWLIAATLVLSAVLGLGANYLLNKYFQRYTATGMLQITDQRPPDPLDKSRQYIEMDTTRMAFLQRTQAQMLRWDGTVVAAIQNGPKIRETSWFKQFVEMQKQPNGTYKEVADVAKAKEDLLERLSVSPIQESMLISCAFQWRDPQDCKIVVEDLVNQHLSDQLQQRTSRDQQRSVDLNQLRNSLTFKYNTLADDIRRLQVDLNKEGITTQSGAGSPKEIELARLVESWARAQDDLAEAQGMLDGLTSRQAKGEWPAAVEMEVDRDPQIN